MQKMVKLSGQLGRKESPRESRQGKEKRPRECESERGGGGSEAEKEERTREKRSLSARLSEKASVGTGTSR